jgi:hypothetical protein
VATAHQITNQCAQCSAAGAANQAALGGVAHATAAAQYQRCAQYESHTTSLSHFLFPFFLINIDLLFSQIHLQSTIY